MSDSEEFKYLIENNEEFRKDLLESKIAQLAYENRLFTLEDIQTRNVDSWCYWHNPDGTRGWPGNILIDKSDKLNFWDTGHAGIIGVDAKYSIEANKNGFSNSGSSFASSESEIAGVQSIPIEEWATRVGKYKDARPNSVCLSVKGETTEQMTAAAAWAETQIGKPYNLFNTNNYDTREYYCSKLVCLA